MKLIGTTKFLVFGLLLLTALFAFAAEKDSGGQVVDSGTFSVYMSAHRVATETFSIRKQTGGASTIVAQVKQQDGPAAQESELQITGTGGLVRYEWRELAPGKSSLLLVPNNEFLMETVTEKPGDKPSEQPFLMPNTSMVLDNNFFVQRQVLAWRYLSSSCTAEGAGLKCGPGDFGIIIPQGRISARVTVQPVGDEKIIIRGKEHVLLHLNFKSDDGEWALWLNPQDSYKLLRVTKPGENMEVLRD